MQRPFLLTADGKTARSGMETMIYLKVQQSRWENLTDRAKLAVLSGCLYWN